MAEMQRGRSAGNLGLRALLYASERMDARQAADFEQRLETDQESREALSDAVEFLQRWDQHIPSQPDAGYRQHVRQRLLRDGVGLVKRLAGPRLYCEQPLLWGTIGAVAAALLVGLCLRQTPAENRAHTVTPKTETPAVPVAQHEEPVGEEIDPMSGKELELWADLPRSRHLLKVHHEESERKRRSELEMRTVLRTGIGSPVIAKNDPAN